jgi:hypothetical protein
MVLSIFKYIYGYINVYLKMDSLQEVVHSLDKTHQGEFISFIQRNKYRKGRKDLQLFNLLKQDKIWGAKELVQQLKTSNLNAYHTLRKRLFSHLADFIILKSTSDDASALSHINGMMGVVDYLFNKNLDKHGWKYLLIAENLAIQHEYHDNLNSIYLVQIEKSHLNAEMELNIIIEKYKDNHKVLQQNETLQIASSIIRAQLNKQKAFGIEIQFQKIVFETLDNLNINVNVLKTPRIVLAFVKIIRAGIIAKKDFNAFEPFLIENYNRLYADREKNYNPVVQAEFLYMMVHTSYRNKKFEQSLSYLDELSLVIKTGSKAYAKQVYSKVVQLKSANLIFLDRLGEAQENLKNLLKESDSLNKEVRINTILNLGIYYFLNSEFNKTQELLLELHHSDSWYSKIMGVEWALKKNMMEVLLYIEMDHLDLAESRIRSIERTFSSLKSKEMYKKAFDFLHLLKGYLFKYINDPEALAKEINKSIDFVPYDQEDIQAMAFYAWIKSKSTKQNFYDTLLSLVR